MDRNLYTKAVLAGGLIAGVLSAIPGLNLANCCCCGLWMMVGGVIASYIYVSGVRSWPGDGEGALVGLGAGVIGGAMGSAAYTAWQLLSRPEETLEVIEPLLSSLPPEFAEAMRQSMEMRLSPLTLVMDMIVMTMFFCAVSTLAGFVATRFFRDRRLRRQFTPYPPPPNWHPPGPGYYGPPPGAAPYGYPPPPTHPASYPPATYPPAPAPRPQPPAAPAPSPEPAEEKPKDDGGEPGPDQGGSSSGPGAPPWGGQT